MRSAATEPFDYLMFVDGSQYDEDRCGWDYWLEIENEEGIGHGHLMKGIDTKEA